ncbi:MAG TPA: YdbL family protein [Gammaproteobacteria bacterium]|nr:YdbL family protein [Gammaproteobacteria bacterium]
MRTLRIPMSLFLLLFATACVTINVYFPAEAAEKAADRIILDVYGATPPQTPQKIPAEPQQQPAEPQPQSLRDRPGLPARTLALALDWLVAPAHAEADLSINTPAIRQLTASMEARHRTLGPYYASGAVGMTRDGQIDVRDQKLVPLAERNTVRNLVAEENRDRSALYAEMARANDHPEWEGEIRATFARRWVDNARAGWWYMDGSGAWKQK